MVRYEVIDIHARLLPVKLLAPFLARCLEYAVDHLLEHVLDLTHVDARFTNEAAGTPAYPPAILLKVALWTYTRSVASRRAIARRFGTLESVFASLRHDKGLERLTLRGSGDVPPDKVGRSEVEE